MTKSHRHSLPEEQPLRTIRVCLVDDRADLRALVRETLASEPDIAVVGEAADGEEALEVIGKCRPDVVLLDVQMPRRSGLEVLEELGQRGAIPTTLLFTSDMSLSTADAIRSGARGVLHKQKGVKRVPGAIRALAGGRAGRE
jgi:DNA-binding NarL/FixJ family response regulator